MTRRASLGELALDVGARLPNGLGSGHALIVAWPVADFAEANCVEDSRAPRMDANLRSALRRMSLTLSRLRPGEGTGEQVALGPEDLNAGWREVMGPE